MGGPRAEKTASKRPPFELADALVAAGTQLDIDLKVARLPPGMWTDLPVVVLHGSRPGPTMFVSGAIHGDELNGVPIVRELVRRVDPEKLSGTLLAVPIVNVFAVSMGSRYMPDRRDLNRSFPGSARGSLAGRLANLFFTRIVSRCSVGVDMHTGSNGRANLPQIRCDLDDPETRRYGEAFGAPLLKHAVERTGTLRAAASAVGVRVLLDEAGEAERFNDRAIELGVAGTLRIMRRLRMIKTAPVRKRVMTAVARTSGWTRAGRSGFCVLDVRLGHHVTAGDRLGVITDSVGLAEMPIRARTTGVVIGLLRTAVVHQGDAVVHIAEVGE